MNVIAKLIALTLFLASLIACSSGKQGNGNIASENRTITTAFTEIKVQQGINLYLSQGNDVDLKVEADENLIELLISEVDNGVLKLYFKENIQRATAKNVYLTTASISKINCSSGASVVSETPFTINSLELDSSSGSAIKMTVNSENIKTASSSGSKITLQGQTTTFEGDSSSGSTIDADKLKSSNASVSVSSGANISIFTSNTITAKASSGGNIHYKGTPKQVTKESSSGGNISGN